MSEPVLSAEPLTEHDAAATKAAARRRRIDCACTPPPSSDKKDAARTGSSREDVDQDLLTEVIQLRRAMLTRASIDQARGILMATFSLSSETAWSVLVTTSQNTNTKLHRLADDLVGTVQGVPLPKAVQQQLTAAVAKTNANPAAPGSAS